MKKKTIKFDERFKNFEHYLYRVRDSLVSDFIELTKPYDGLGLTLQQIMEQDPMVTVATYKMDHFDEFVKDFFGYVYDKENHRYVYEEDE